MEAELLVNSFSAVACGQIRTVHPLCVPWLVALTSSVTPLWSPQLVSSLQSEEEQEGGTERPIVDIAP